MELTTTGPYDRCIDCPNLGNGCDGPRTNAMSIERWCIWFKSLKRRRGYTVNEIHEGTGVSERTIENILSGNISENIGRTTMKLLEDFLGGSSGTWPCSMDLNREEKVIYMDKPETLDALRERTEQVIQLRRRLDEFTGVMEKTVDVVDRKYSEGITNQRADILFLQSQLKARDAQIAYLQGRLERIEAQLDRMLAERE